MIIYIRFKIAWSDRRNPLKHPRLNQGVPRSTHKKLPAIIKNAIHPITLAYEIYLYRYLSYPDVAVCTHMYTCKLACVWYIDMCTTYVHIHHANLLPLKLRSTHLAWFASMRMYSKSQKSSYILFQLNCNN